MDFREEVIKTSKMVPLGFGDKVKLKAKVEHILVVKDTELYKYSVEEQEELLGIIKKLCRKTNVRLYENDLEDAVVEMAQRFKENMNKNNMSLDNGIDENYPTKKI